MRLVFLCASLFLTFTLSFADDAPSPLYPAPPVDFAHLPWRDGESVSYLVSWNSLYAAEGTFSAHDRGDHWEFNLALASAGMVNDIYPFSGTFWCLLAKAPWRSTEYGQFRFEPKRAIKERTQVDYILHQGTLDQWVEGKSKTFPIAEDALDDLGTMLYHMRTGPWKPGDKRTMYVYQNGSEKQALATCEARETRTFGIWPAQPLLRLYSAPTKQTQHRASLRMWVTDDARRLPLHAELEFRYGTFSIDLTKAENTPPAVK